MIRKALTIITAIIISLTFFSSCSNSEADSSSKRSTTKQTTEDCSFKIHKEKAVIT